MTSHDRKEGPTADGLFHSLKHTCICSEEAGYTLYTWAVVLSSFFEILVDKSTTRSRGFYKSLGFPKRWEDSSSGIKYIARQKSDIAGQRENRGFCEPRTKKQGKVFKKSASPPGGEVLKTCHLAEHSALIKYNVGLNFNVLDLRYHMIYLEKIFLYSLKSVLK